MRAGRGAGLAKLVYLVLVVPFAAVGLMGPDCNNGGSMGDMDGGVPEGGLPDGGLPDGGVDGGGARDGGDDGGGGGPNTATDPQDLTGPDGDPSVDVTLVERATDSSGAPWVRAIVAGSWPPSDSFYSWFLTVELYRDGSTAPAVEITRQRHDGTDETFVTGLDMSEVTVTDEAEGPLFVVDPGALAEPPDSFAVTSGVQKTVDGTRITDEVPMEPFGEATANP